MKCPGLVWPSTVSENQAPPICCSFISKEGKVAAQYPKVTLLYKTVSGAPGRKKEKGGKKGMPSFFHLLRTAHTTSAHISLARTQLYGQSTCKKVKETFCCFLLSIFCFQQSIIFQRKFLNEKNSSISPLQWSVFLCIHLSFYLLSFLSA